MDLRLALTNSPAGHFWLTALVFVAAKVIATVVQLAMSRGEYRELPQTSLFRAVYWTGKLTPALAAACFCAAEILLHDAGRAWADAGLSIVALLLAVYVVRLRKQGRFFGGLEALLRKRSQETAPHRERTNGEAIR
jgi:hypothetical protein